MSVHVVTRKFAAAGVESDSKMLGGCAQADSSIVLQGGSTKGGQGGSTMVSVSKGTQRLLLPVVKMTAKCWAGVLRPAAP